MISKKQLFLLALLEELGGELANTDMQKYLFLASRYQEQSKKIYHFVPYKFGCFSFNAYADKRKLIEKQILIDSNKWILAEDQGTFYFRLSSEDKLLVKKIKNEFRDISGKKLIRHIYLNYPYYAINSEILSEVLNESEMVRVEAARPRETISAIYTIGYEEKSLEEYINQLIKDDVKILIDVRKNPISRKYGFSKKTLQKAIEEIGIEYRHIPELGISSEDRVNLANIEDYNRLFDQYEKEVLNNSHELLKMINRLVIEKHRVGLTCFEKLPEYCHRSRVARAIIHNFNQQLDIIDL